MRIHWVSREFPNKKKNTETLMNTGLSTLGILYRNTKDKFGSISKYI